jgi:hypothetical protein
MGRRNSRKRVKRSLPAIVCLGTQAMPNHALVVSFQEVVHSALTGNSEVAKPPEGGEPDTHKNAPLTPKG